MSQVINIKERGEWDTFLSQVKPHTFLHSWNWGAFNEKIGNKVFRLGITDKSGGVEGIVLVLKIEARRGSFLFVPHGPVLKSTKIKHHMTMLFEYLKNLAKEEKCSFVRISPILENSEENNKIFSQAGFQDAPIHMMHPELAWILAISGSEDEVLKNMRKSTRYSIKKAKKEGVKVFSSNDPSDTEKFWNVYKETVSRQHFTPFSKEYIRKEIEAFGKDNEISFFFAEYKGEIISAAVVVFQKMSGFYHHGASIQKYTQVNASHLIQWEAIREAKARGCQYYNFWGVVPENLKNHPWTGISLFKRGFGGNSEAYVHAKDLAVSSKYWLNYIIEKVRKIKRGL